MVALSNLSALSLDQGLETDLSLSREQLIDRIQTLNPTASAEYLARFTEGDLNLYLDHLSAAFEPRGRLARWRRRGETRAIQRFVPADEV
jgi:hypothetical protein